MVRWCLNNYDWSCVFLFDFFVFYLGIPVVGLAAGIIVVTAIVDVIVTIIIIITVIGVRVIAVPVGILVRDPLVHALETWLACRWIGWNGRTCRKDFNDNCSLPHLLLLLGGKNNGEKTIGRRRPRKQFRTLPGDPIAACMNRVFVQYRYNIVLYRAWSAVYLHQEKSVLKRFLFRAYTHTHTHVDKSGCIVYFLYCV